MQKIIGIILLFLGLNLFSQSSTFIVKNVTGAQFLLSNVIKTSDGGKLIVGGYDSLTVVKADSDNNVLWSHSIYYPINSSQSIDLIEKNSCYYICYQVASSNSGNLLIFKFNNSGQLLFSKTIYCPNINWFQTNKKSSFSVTNNNEVIINSSYAGIMSIHKIDNLGNLIYGYKVNCDTVNANGSNYGYSSVLCNDGGIMLTGRTDTSGVVVKLDNLGLFQWAKSYHPSTQKDYRPQNIIKKIDGSFIISGYSIDFVSGIGQVPFLMNIDSAGNLNWYNEYSLEQYNENAKIEIIETSTNSIIVFYANTGILIEIGNTGNVITRRRLSLGCKSIHPYINQLYFNCDDRLIVTSNDIIQENCIPIDSLPFQITKTVTSNSVVTNTYAKIEPYGTFFNYPLALFDTKAYIEQICNIVGVEEINKIEDIKIYPNPTNSIINITDVSNEIQNATIKIENNLGQVVFTSNYTKQINLSHFSSGIYFLTVQDNSNKKTVKIIKQ